MALFAGAMPALAFSGSDPAPAEKRDSRSGSDDPAFIPLFDVLRNLDVQYVWKAETGILILTSERGSLSLMPGSRHVISGNAAITLKTAPFFRNGQIMIDESFLPTLLSIFSSSSLKEIEDPEGMDRIDRLFKTIVIDPGHGGDDEGAISPSGVKEKDIVLEIAREVKKIIDRKLGIRVVLTRDGDYFVPLEDRTAIAANVNADLFVSIHANSTSRKSIRGVETYFMNLDASDDDAMAAAVAENSVIKFEGKSFEADSDLAAILFDMAQTEHLLESSRFAMLIHGRLGKVLDTVDRGVKQAPFIVLANASMPAVLLEVGFMSNAKDLEMLKKDGTQEGIAEAIFESIESFKEDMEQKMRSRPGIERNRAVMGQLELK